MPEKNRALRLLVVLLIGGGTLWGLGLAAPAAGTVAAPNSDAFSLPEACGHWEQVNISGFGLPSEFSESGKPTMPSSDMPFRGEEGFETLVFKDQLYLGMEADNHLGARLWRTRSGVLAPFTQLDWEEVSAPDGYHPFGVSDTAQADHVDSLAAFKGKIYVSLANRSGHPQGTLVFRSLSGNRNTWEDALTLPGSGFGKPHNENFKDMQVFDGQLCGGTWNERDGAEVWCSTDGQHWMQKNQSGFGDAGNFVIWSGHVFGGRLYFGVQYRQGDEDDALVQGRLYRTSSLDADEPLWEKVFETPMGTGWGNLLGDLDGYLYLSTPSPEGMLVYRSLSGDRDTWEMVSQPGIDGSPEIWGVLADGATVYHGALYLAVVSSQRTFTLWRTDGSIAKDGNVNWEQIPTDEIGPYNIYAQLIPFNGALYAWTSNPVYGQQVWRTVCGTDTDRP